MAKDQLMQEHHEIGLLSQVLQHLPSLYDSSSPGVIRLAFPNYLQSKPHVSAELKDSICNTR